MHGRDVRFIQAKATLYDDEVDEAHDLFYLVRMPENSLAATSSFQNSSPHSQNLGGTTAKRKSQHSRLFFPRNVNSVIPYETNNSLMMNNELHQLSSPIENADTAVFNNSSK